eukprot:TRINITY_DN1738_c0_g1_i5.p1 TRINITY_DN1738_c0_g1~~TRINITY_DN1738_c0_g1_i5.p1  ORF type:complete len:338 (+),score=32.29 TRINITY_DN1738_c0_g1_i5:330-1343(+)
MWMVTDGLTITCLGLTVTATASQMPCRALLIPAGTGMGTHHTPCTAPQHAMQGGARPVYGAYAAAARYRCPTPAARVDRDRDGIPDTLQSRYSYMQSRVPAHYPPTAHWQAHNMAAPRATVGVDVDGDGRADYYVSGVDRDGDGIPDAMQGAPHPSRHGYGYAPHPMYRPPAPRATVAVDVDGDGRADYYVSGVDRDGDGIPDAMQGAPHPSRHGYGYAPHPMYRPPAPRATVAVDVDGDGRADYYVSGVDRDGDGIPDAMQGGARPVYGAYAAAARYRCPTPAARVDRDRDGIPDTLQSRYSYMQSRVPAHYPPTCLLYTSPSPRDRTRSRMPSSA